MLRRLLAGAGVLAALAWLALRPPPAPEPADGLLKRDFLAMGTLVSLSVYVAPGQDRAAADQALAGAEDAMLEFERVWSAWGEGLLGQINRTVAAGQPFLLSGAHRALFELAERARAASSGRFDARLGALVRLWGFDDESNFRSAPPDPAQIAAGVAAVAAAPGFEPGTPWGPAPGTQWDFGAIAKGAAVDEAVALLRERGFADVIVNAGGNLRATGRRGERPWRIGIRHPRASAPGDVLAWLETSQDEAVVTSGDYERYFEHGGVRYHHVLDPATGGPARGLRAVTVVHASAAWADAASTALLVAGPDQWREAARQLAVDQVLAVDAAGTAWVTHSLAPRLRFAAGVTPREVP